MPVSVPPPITCDIKGENHYNLRATSHTRLRARDHYTSSTQSHWWKRWTRSKFASSHYAWGTNGVCECKRDVKSTWIPTWHWIVHIYGHLDYFQKPPLRGRPHTKPGDHGTPNAHDRWFILLYHVWGPAWTKSIEIAFDWGPNHKWLHTTLEGPRPHYRFWKCVGTIGPYV